MNNSAVNLSSVRLQIVTTITQNGEVVWERSSQRSISRFKAYANVALSETCDSLPSGSYEATIRVSASGIAFISSSLNEKGKTPTEKIRNYFFNTFYKEHLSNYTVGVSGKRPIYWMLSSGKKKGFKALIYMHRWYYGTLSGVRSHQLYDMINYYKNAIENLDSNFVDEARVAPAPRKRASPRRRS